MTNGPLADDLSDKVIYEQNIYFVKTGRGDLFPKNKIMLDLEALPPLVTRAQIKYRLLLFAGMLAMGIGWLLVLLIMREAPAPQIIRIAVSGTAGLMALICFGIACWMAHTGFAACLVVLNPARYAYPFLKRSGCVIKGKAYFVQRLDASTLTFTYTFLPPGHQYWQSDFTGYAQVSTRRDLHDSDEIVVFYYNKDIHFVL